MEYATIVTVFLFLILLWMLYGQLKRPAKYWENLGVRAVPGQPLLIAMFRALQRSRHEMEVERYKKYGSVYGYYEGSSPAICVGKPELLRDIFVKDFAVFPGGRDIGMSGPVVKDMILNLHGEEWKRVRTIITPAFSTGKMRKMASTMLESAEVLCNNLKKSSKIGKPINAKKFFGKFTLDVIARCVFGTKIDSLNEPGNPFVKAGENIFSGNATWKHVAIFLAPALAKFLKLDFFDREATTFFKDATVEIITERRKSPGKKHNDLLQLMMDAEELSRKGIAMKDEDDALGDNEDNLKEMGNEAGNEKLFTTTTKMKGLSMDELVANCTLFFFAGYETTAASLSYVSYLLAVNPDCQEKLIAELDECIRQNNNKLDYEAVQNMKYLDMSITETLRVFPPASRTERLCAQDYKLGDTGITIKKGMVVNIPIFPIHHDAKHYPDPEKFNPLRFSTEGKSGREAYTYLPFGGGPRNCLGMRFSLVETKMCLAYVLSRYRFKRCPQTQVPLQFDAGQGLLQPKEIIIQLEQRTDGVKFS